MLTIMGKKSKYIFRSASICKNLASECRRGLRSKAVKNNRYDTDSMEVRELHSNLIKCIEAYNTYCLSYPTELSAKDKDILKIYYLEPIEIDINQCISYIEQLKNKDYKVDVDVELLNEYKKNTSEQYNSEWGE